MYYSGTRLYTLFPIAGKILAISAVLPKVRTALREKKTHAAPQFDTMNMRGGRAASVDAEQL